MQNIFEEYALVQSQIDALTLKKEQLRPHILQSMIEKGETKIETSVGSFSLSKRKVYQFPEWVNEKEEEFKEAKEKAISTGEAIAEEVESLRFTGIKL